MTRTITVNDIKATGMCCGCAACLAICPKQAIEMGVDSYGYSIPMLNEAACVECGLCMMCCPMRAAACGYDDLGIVG